ncbi:pirin family protein [Acidithiobacillus concretivorus]|uniref:Pirin family protein n=1 Tax=Acidithiobacillus concretivorus TaxID=3063952 RepID=A0ABS5ZTW0_9PROT|nr:pirin family protein [Acidithiobacillus concretivorus]MBU2739940.1 pirin family protein [Acidithiobacillus concretivorus]
MNNLISERLAGVSHDLGDGFNVHRVLPPKSRRAVGPFVFMDHLGPVELPAERAMDVRPHPHIGLATVTYLWEGRIEHKDGLGNTQIIESGDVNWMTAGRGIVHSERTAAADRNRSQDLHGLQLWVALPREHETCDPMFEHTDAADLPRFDLGSADVRVVAGTAYGKRSPVTTQGELFYVDVHLPAGSELPLPEEYPQRAAYLIDGEAEAGGEALRPRELTLFTPGGSPRIRAIRDAHLVLLGGAPLDAPRYLWWNYVASSEALLEAAREAWRNQRYPMVEGDPEFILLPNNRDRVTLLLQSE